MHMEKLLRKKDYSDKTLYEIYSKKYRGRQKDRQRWSQVPVLFTESW